MRSIYSSIIGLILFGLSSLAWSTPTNTDKGVSHDTYLSSIEPFYISAFNKLPDLSALTVNVLPLQVDKPVMVASIGKMTEPRIGFFGYTNGKYLSRV